MEDDVIQKAKIFILNRHNDNFNDMFTYSNLTTTIEKVGFTDFILLSQIRKKKTSLVNGNNYSG